MDIAKQELIEAHRKIKVIKAENQSLLNRLEAEREESRRLKNALKTISNIHSSK